MDNVTRKTLKRLINTFHEFVPGIEPINDNEPLTKQELIEKVKDVRGIRPVHIAAMQGRSPFAVRDQLRRAADRGKINHRRNRPWQISGDEYLKLYG